MIRRDDNEDWLLIPQTEHARLSAEMAAVWGSRQISPLPMAECLVPAILHHDDGWREWTPTIDPQTGRPRSFTEMPMTVATDLWSRSIDVCSRLEETPSPTPDADSSDADSIGSRITESALFGGIWVSRHFCYLAEQVRRHHPEESTDVVAVERFLDEQTHRQSAWKNRLQELFPDVDVDDWNRRLETGYRWLQFFDRLSLWLCLGSSPLSRRLKPYEHQTDEHRADEHRADGSKVNPALSIAGQLLPGPIGGSSDTGRLALKPYPLSVPRLDLSVSARRIPAKPFSSNDDFCHALEHAPIVTLRWKLEPGHTLLHT